MFSDCGNESQTTARILCYSLHFSHDFAKDLKIFWFLRHARRSATPTLPASLYGPRPVMGRLHTNPKR